MKKIVVCLLVFVFMLSDYCMYTGYGDEINSNELYALGACLLDGDSGRVLYEKNGSNILANASTTKIMTCIIALEYGNLDDVVTISKYAASMPDVQLNAKEGDTFYLKDLLYSLMLESHNDSAIAIAEHIAGSVEGFAELMNKKAYDIGCYDTYFITPNGLDATDETGKFHSTTAIDLARIMSYCIKNEMFVEITNVRNHSFTNLSGDRSYSVSNKNAFLDMMDGVISGKTGFTNDAGYCYVGALQRDGKTYTIALLGCGWPYNKNYKWQDSKKLFNYGVNEFFKETVTNSDIVLPKIMIKNGYIAEKHNGINMDKSIYVDCYIQNDDFEILMKSNEKVEYEIDMKNIMEAPINKGEVVGKLKYKIGEEEIKEYNIYANTEVKKINYKWIIKSVTKMFFLN